MSRTVIFAGGAPANVAIAVARNGMGAGICCKVGNDDFGKFLIRTLEENNVSILCPETTDKATTTMAFVTLRENGERSFTFARKPGADMFLTPGEIKEEDIAASKIVHAGSCSLSKEPVSAATVRALKLGYEMRKLVSFDVNYRNLIWDGDVEAATAKVMEILSYVNLLKISETVKQLRAKADMEFDVHLMVTEPVYFPLCIVVVLILRHKGVELHMNCRSCSFTLPGDSPPAFSASQDKKYPRSVCLNFEVVRLYMVKNRATAG